MSKNRETELPVEFVTERYHTFLHGFSELSPRNNQAPTGVVSLTVISVGNEIDDTSANPGRVSFYFTS